MMPAYIAGIILVGIYLPAKWIRFQLLCSFVVHLALAIEILFYPVPIYSDDTLFGWENLSKQVERMKQSYPGAFVFSADEYKTSAVLNFFSDSLIYSRNVIGEPALQFDYIGTDLKTLEGRSALFLNSLPRLREPETGKRFPPALNNYFDSVEELSPVVIRNHGVPVRKFLVFYCRNYHANFGSHGPER